MDASCPNCGYSTEGLPGDVCPECGLSYEEARRRRVSPALKIAALSLLTACLFLGVLAGVSLGSGLRDAEILLLSVWLMMSVGASAHWPDIRRHRLSAWPAATVMVFALATVELIDLATRPVGVPTRGIPLWVYTPVLPMMLAQIGLVARLWISPRSPDWRRSMVCSLGVTAGLLAVFFFWAARGLVIPGVSDYTDLDGWLPGGHQPLVSRDAAWRGVIWASITLALLGTQWRPRGRPITPTS